MLITGATEKAKAERDERRARRSENRRELGELKGQMAEKDAEIDRLQKALFDAEAENLQRRAKRVASRQAPRHDASARRRRSARCS